MQADGVTLYFAAESDDGLGGLDLYVTRFNQETGKYVRPENLGLPYNSPANDYLFATDETAGVALLVTDRRQPADKVCLYWLSIDSVFEGTPYHPDSSASSDAAELEADTVQLRAYAALSSIAATMSRIDHNYKILCHIPSVLVYFLFFFSSLSDSSVLCLLLLISSISFSIRSFFTYTSKLSIQIK